MSATGQAIPLAEAQRIATEVVGDLTPYCARIEVAGSIRRCKPSVSDIELVAIPKWNNLQVGLFGDTKPVNELWRYLQGSAPYRWLKGNNPTGRYYQMRQDDEIVGMQIDLFLADERNWGWIYLLRTGSADFSQSLLARWKRVQKIHYTKPGSVDGRLVHRDGSVLATPDEASVFAAVHLGWIAPEKRGEAVR